MNSILQEEGQLDKGRMPHEGRGRDWSPAATSPGGPGAPGAARDKERAGHGQRLILDSWPQNYERINFCCFEPPSTWFQQPWETDTYPQINFGLCTIELGQLLLI